LQALEYQTILLTIKTYPTLLKPFKEVGFGWPQTAQSTYHFVFLLKCWNIFLNTKVLFLKMFQ